MNIAARIPSTDLRDDLQRHIGRHTDKTFDWDAFPSNRGFAALERAQMRYVGSGGSPKSDDRSTLPPGNYTVSLIYQPPGKYAALHSHEIEEAFLVLEGVLTVGWEQDGEVVQVQLGPRDMILNAPIIPHGFRNDGVDPVLMSIMVGKGNPQAPHYHAHPKSVDPVVAAAFGARDESKVHRVNPASDQPIHRKMTECVVRYSQQRPSWDAAGFARTVYVGEGGAASEHNRKEIITLPRGKGVRPYARNVEDSYFVLDGCIMVGWEENGRLVEERLGPKDLVWNPAGRAHYFRNDGVKDAEFFMVVGSAEPEPVKFEAA